ncbi:MAG TPA: DNA cytosine methyltransferase [Dehalococcoidia bacterium]|nr:DNA cytosine methyltransferase [Dehalococcoidia bacterium]
MLKHLDLFSGIGGFALVCQWAGIETIGFVEIDKYCQKVLRKHWPNVPIVEDIRDVEKIKEIAINATAERCLAKQFETGITEQAIQEASSRQSGRTDCLSGNRGGTAGTCESPAILITAGFPCQPFSVAGKRQGEGDDRYLWPETLAVIEAVKPKWVLLENVTGIINLALDTVLSDLEGAGYSYETLIIPACAVNAWHRRDRVWIVANCEGSGWPTRASKGQSGRCREDMAISPSRESKEQTEQEGREDSGRGSQEVAVADTNGQRLQGHRGLRECGGEWLTWSGSQALEGIWESEPSVGRVASGISSRVDRLKCLGNAIVPQVAYEIIKVISMNEEING